MGLTGGGKRRGERGEPLPPPAEERATRAARAPHAPPLSHPRERQHTNGRQIPLQNLNRGAQVIFRVAWCRDKGACRGADYLAASGVVWKLMACLALFALANFLKALATKLLSAAFYRTAHFKKVKEALDKVCVVGGAGCLCVRG